MEPYPKYLRHEIKCPERDELVKLLSEWRTQDGQTILNGLHCDDSNLKDLSGADCQWSCWEQISRAKS